MKLDRFRVVGSSIFHSISMGRHKLFSKDYAQHLMNPGGNLYDKRIDFKNWVGVVLAFLFYEQKLV